MIGRSLALALLLAGAGVTGIATAAVPCAECVTAGAASDTLRVPSGTPLAGYGSMKRRLLLPDVFDRHADDITYYYTSRLPGEPAGGVNDIHFHPVESRSFRLAALVSF